jgi:ATP-dependent Clp protease protease subunit
LNKKKIFWEFRAKKETNEGELMLYGPVSSYSWFDDEITPKKFKEDLDALGKIDVLNVYINSPGGDVFAGQSIYSMLKRHSATVNVHVDGLAASISSIIAMAGDRVYMPKNAMMMIHNPSTDVWGTANEMREMADRLDNIRGSLLAVYKDKTDKTDEELIEMLDAETWMTADEAVEHGFADEVIEEKKIAACIDGEEIFNNYKKIPETVKSLSLFKNNKDVYKSREKISLDIYAQQILLNRRKAQCLKSY